MGRVSDKVAIVTGAASDPGLGHETALTLAREGARLVVTDIDGRGADACAAKIRAAGGEAVALTHDVTSEAAWQAVIAAALESFGRVDILVNNAGIAVLKPLEALSLDDWNRQIAVNLTSVFLGCRTVAAPMRRAGGGSIVNLSSVLGLIGLPTCTAYGAAKGGVRLMSKSIAADLGKDNIRCNSVHPGVIWTNMQAVARGGDRAAAEAAAAAMPLGRVGEAADIANCVLYLASDESRYVTGAGVHRRRGHDGGLVGGAMRRRPGRAPGRHPSNASKGSVSAVCGQGRDRPRGGRRRRCRPRCGARCRRPAAPARWSPCARSAPHE